MSGSGLAGTGPVGLAPVGDGGVGAWNVEEMVVVSDERFPRCPLSNEVFEVFWDEEEGDYMSRHAVKVLVDQSSQDLYSKAVEIKGSPLRYLIVHQMLVLDRWIAEGLAESVKSCISRLRTAPGGISQEEIDAILAADDDCDEQEEDIFILSYRKQK